VPVEESSVSSDTAAHALAGATRAAPVRTWDDLAGAGVVGLLGAERAAAFARSFLAPLAEDAVLLETLAAFLRHHGSRGEVAADLGVHRNTVRNRIEHIESLLGASLDDPRVRVDAWVALQAPSPPVRLAHQRQQEQRAVLGDVEP
jgi:purine catabolism regulator